MAKKGDRKTDPHNKMPMPKPGQMCDGCGKHKADSIFKKMALCPDCLNMNVPGYEKRIREFYFSRTIGSVSSAQVRTSRRRTIGEQMTDTYAGTGAILQGGG